MKKRQAPFALISHRNQKETQMTARIFKAVNGRRFPSVDETHAPFVAAVYKNAMLDGARIELGSFATFYEAAEAAARYDFAENNGARGCVVIPQGGRHGKTVPHPVFYSTTDTQ